MTHELTHSQKSALQQCGEHQITAAQSGDLQSLQDNVGFMHKLLEQFGAQQYPSKGFSQQALLQACKAGHLQCVKFLIEDADISYSQHLAVRCTIESNHADCLKLLMEHTQLPLHIYQLCLSESVKHNQPQCLQILVDHFQDNADYNTLLMTSAIREHHECVDILYPIGNPKHALMRIQTYHDEEMGSYLAAKLQQERLHTAVGGSSSFTRFKKM